MIIGITIIMIMVIWDMQKVEVTLFVVVGLGTFENVSMSDLWKSHIISLEAVSTEKQLKGFLTLILLIFIKFSPLRMSFFGSVSFCRLTRLEIQWGNRMHAGRIGWVSALRTPLTLLPWNVVNVNKEPRKPIYKMDLLFPPSFQDVDESESRVEICSGF